MKNVLAIYDSPESLASMQPDDVFFDTVGKPRKLTYAVGLGITYQIMKTVGIQMAALYFITSMYEKEGLYHDVITVEKINPIIIQAGITLRPLGFGSNRKLN